MQNPISSKWLSENESEFRQLVRNLYHKYSGWHLGIESDDLWHIVYIKLSKCTSKLNDLEHLRRSVCVTARNILCDLSRQKTRRAFYFSKPMPTRSRPLPGSTIETVASKESSADLIAALLDDIAIIRSMAANDQKMTEVFKGIEELTDRGLPSSCSNLSRQLQLPYKQMRGDLKQFRSLARNVLR